MHIVKEVQPAPIEFEDWYALYPLKVGKKAAIKAWTRLSDAQRQAALEALPAHIAYWRTLDWYHPPHPATWLNGARWEDELPVARNACKWCGNQAEEGRRYCAKHQMAIARGETPSRR